MDKHDICNFKKCLSALTINNNDAKVSSWKEQWSWILAAIELFHEYTLQTSVRSDNWYMHMYIYVTILQYIRTNLVLGDRKAYNSSTQEAKTATFIQVIVKQFWSLKSRFISISTLSPVYVLFPKACSQEA